MKYTALDFETATSSYTSICSVGLCMVEDGKILEEGTHEELLAKQGRYYELYETQAKYYREHSGEGGSAE